MNSQRSVSIIIPAYNEANTIAKVVKGAIKPIINIDNIKAIVIDDGSTDQTGQLAEDAGAVVVRFAHNKGLGAAFGQGIKTALSLGADVIVNIDADGQFNTDDISKLIQPILDNKVNALTF